MLAELQYRTKCALYQENLENSIFWYVLRNILTKIWGASIQQMAILCPFSAESELLRREKFSNISLTKKGITFFDKKITTQKKSKLAHLR